MTSDVHRYAYRRGYLRFNAKRKLGAAMRILLQFGGAGIFVLFAVEDYQLLNKLKAERADTINRWHSIDFLEKHPRCEAVDDEQRQCTYFAGHDNVEHDFGFGAAAAG